MVCNSGASLQDGREEKVSSGSEEDEEVVLWKFRAVTASKSKGNQRFSEFRV